MSKFLCYLIICLAMLGCASAPEKTVVVYKPILMKPPTALTSACDVAAAPDEKEFVHGTPDERLDLLFRLNIEHYKNAALCNARLSSLRKWIKDQELLSSKKAD